MEALQKELTHCSAGILAGISCGQQERCILITN